MITSVEIFNFLSHKKNEIPFDNGVQYSLEKMVQGNLA